MVQPDRCPACGAERPANAHQAACPCCLMRLGLDDPVLGLSCGGTGVTTGPAGDRAGGGVLATLAASLGPIPAILLRDTEAAPEPILRPLTTAGPASLGGYGRLQLLGEMARGGMGAVLKGRDTDLGRELAVKVLLDRHRDQPELVRRFLEEAQIAGQLQHPGIVPVYELGAFADRRPYFTMKLVKGSTLAEILRDRPAPGDDLPRLLTVFLQVTQTMAYAHARGVIHRDLKPSNIMVGSFGEVQVMDWGLAKVLPRGGAVDDASAGMREGHETVIATARSGDDSDLSRAGSVLGTPAYMAPEQARGERDHLDERCDVFALGSILCEVLTGEPAFTGRTSGDIQRKAARGETADAAARLDASGADPEVLGLARDCLAREAGDRPRDAGAVAGRLSAHLAGVQDRLRAAELARAAESARAEEAEGRAKAERRARRMMAAMAASVIGLIALGAVGYTGAQRQRAERMARVSAGVDAALAEADRLAGEARAEPGNAAKWAEAIARARRSEDLVAQGEGRGEADPPTRRRAVEAVARLVRERDDVEERTRRNEADRRLLDRLAEVRGASVADYGDDKDTSATDAAYADAFREAGLDPDGRPAEEIGAAIRARPTAVAQALAAALDDWAAIRRGWGSNAAGAARLAEAARAADPDPWRCALRAAVSRPDKESRLAELRRLKETARLDELGAGSLDLLGRALHDDGESSAAESVLREAQRRHPGDLWINFDLGQVLARLLKHNEAVRCYYAARAIRPAMGLWLADALLYAEEKDEAVAILRGMARRSPENGEVQHNLFRTLLYTRGSREEAQEACAAAVAAERAAIRSRPGDATHHLRLGDLLMSQQKFDEAEAAYREAIRLSPGFAGAHLSLAMLIRRPGRLGEAEAAIREAIRLQPLWAAAYQVQGTIFQRQGRLAEAEAAAREAVRLGPDNGVNNMILGVILTQRGKFAEAAFQSREAIRLAPNLSLARRDLGRALEYQGKPAEAEAVFREAIRLEPDRPWHHRGLGELLRRQGKMRDALESLRRADSLARTPGMPPPSMPIPDEIRRAERQAALAPRLPAVLEGDDRPADPAEGLDLARLCLDRDRPAAAARLYADAFAADPGLAEERGPTPHRLAAARAAALAGRGMGRDDPRPDAEAQARLRRQALGWFEEELAAWSKVVDSGDPNGRKQALSAIARWYTDPDLAGVREPESLGALPEAERAGWRALWAAVDALQKRTASPPR